jgi:WD repeat-containing protein 89
MKWQSTENNDDITDLHFHPSRRSHLLSGGIDGLVSVFDTNINDEDDSLLQVVNHGPIHKAGFLSDDVIFALSHDEQFSIHAVTSDTEEAVMPLAGPFTDTARTNADDILPVHFGDLRPILQCDYAIDVMQFSDKCFVATGTHSRYVDQCNILLPQLTHWHSEPHVDLVQLPTLPSPRFLYDEAVRLIGAHGEEIVRSVYVDDLVSHSGTLRQKMVSNGSPSPESYTQLARTDK